MFSLSFVEQPRQLCDLGDTVCLPSRVASEHGKML